MRRTITVYCLDWELRLLQQWSAKKKLPISTAIKQLVFKEIEREQQLNDDSNRV